MQISVERKLSSLLATLGMPSKLAGYRYIEEAIVILLDSWEQGKYPKVTTELYPIVADTFNSTSSRVERAIRHAIEYIMEKGNMTEVNRIFKHSIDPMKGKPTNYQFLYELAQYCKLYLSESM